MKNKKTILLIILGVVLVLGIGITYAYFSSTVITENQNNQIVTTGRLELVYEDGPEIILNEAYPGDTVTKTIKVKNTGTLETAYTINWTKLINTISNDELVVSSTCSSVIETEEGTNTGTCNAIDETVIVESQTEITTALKEGISILPGETHTYELLITFKELNSDQNYNQGKRFNTVIQISENSRSYAINGRLLDNNDMPVADATVEIHSEVKRAKTNENGEFTIFGVEIGNHEFIVKDSSGNIIVEDTIAINPGEEESVDGKTITGSKKSSINLEFYLNDTETIEKIVIVSNNNLYDVILANNEAQPDTSINFGAISSDTNGKGLYYTEENTDEDGDGNSGRIYYFRGEVENNYLVFAGYCWRIVRTNENGSIKLRFDGTPTIDGENFLCPQTGTAVNIASRINFNSPSNSAAKYVGYTYGNTTNASGTQMYGTTDSNIKEVIDSWYTSKIANQGEDVTNKIANTIYCNDRSIGSTSGSYTYYGAYSRLYTNKKPQFGCPEANNDGYTLNTNNGGSSGYGNNLLTNPVALLTADEMSYAGAVYGTDNKNSSFYLYTGESYWTMSTYHFTGSAMREFFLSNMGYLNDFTVNSASTVIPAISLIPEAKVGSGTGTYDDPYVIEQ